MNNEDEAKLAEKYRLQGVVRSGYDGMEVDLVGGKFNLTDVAARVGLGQLPRIDEFNSKRRERVRLYFEKLDAAGAAALGLALPPRDFEQSNWHMFQVVLPEERLAIKRADVMGQMQAAGIATGVHYPAIHLFAVYRRLGWKDGDLPIAEKICRNILTLPLFPAMSHADVGRVVEALVSILKSNLK
jgi:dTDP-4-amino-4,6-dideoxygalactose transaminase